MRRVFSRAEQGKPYFCFMRSLRCIERAVDTPEQQKTRWETPEQLAAFPRSIREWNGLIRYQAVVPGGRRVAQQHRREATKVHNGLCIFPAALLLLFALGALALPTQKKVHGRRLAQGVRCLLLLDCSHVYRPLSASLGAQPLISRVMHALSFWPLGAIQRKAKAVMLALLAQVFTIPNPGVPWLQQTLTCI